MKGKPFGDRDNQALHDKRMNESVRVAISRKNIEFIKKTWYNNKIIYQCKSSVLGMEI